MTTKTRIDEARAELREVLLRGDVARRLGVSGERVRHLVALGQLAPFAVTVGGIRLFAVEDVDRLRAARENRKAAASRAAMR